MKLCPYHKNGLGWDTCTEGFEGCQFEKAREKAVIEMEDHDNKVICPVCNHMITDFDEGVTSPCEHVMLTYVDMLNGEFVYVKESDEAKEIAENLLGHYEYMQDNDVDEYMEDILQAFVDEDDGYEIISLTTSGMACGPTSSTEYHLIKKG